MSVISTCKISIPAFSATPGPLELEEALQAAEEMERLSAEVSLFPSGSLSIASTPPPSTPLSARPRSFSQKLRDTHSIAGTHYSESSRSKVPTEEGDASLNYSCFEAVRLHYLRKSDSPLTFEPRSHSFPPVRLELATSRDYRSPEGTQDSTFPEFSPPNAACLARMRFPPAFIVQQGEMAPVPRPLPVRPASSFISPGQENDSPTQSRPAVRRKPVPKILSEDDDDPVRTPSFMRFSSMDSFPIFRPNPVAQPLPSTVAKAFRRGDQVKDYSLRHFLSQGAQGKVYLATSDRPIKISAIKVIPKLALGSFRTLLQEQRLLKRIKGHQFVLNMVDSFHDTENFYLVTDYYPGGDLAHLLCKLGAFETDMARFYISELIIAVKFLHERSIVHRDLKPGNILIKSDGHICIVDFGLCKDFTTPSTPDITSSDQSFHTKKPRVSGPTTNGFAGTLVYMSPQAVNQDPYSYETDWWSMGIILYELLQGDTPWVGSDISTMIKKIRREPLVFRKDVHIDPDACDLINKLLKKHVESRLPAKDLESHRFFRLIEFGDVEKGLLTPPYVPAYKSELSATGTLKDLEKIYVGRSYDPSVDPFPEYNYDYSESKSSHSINLEQLADRPNNDLFSLASDDSFSFNLAPTPLTPWPGSRRRKTYSGMDDEKEVARELALSGSFFNLPIDNTFGPRDILKDITTTARNKVKRSTLIVTSSLFRFSGAFCRAIAHPIQSKASTTAVTPALAPPALAPHSTAATVQMSPSTVSLTLPPEQATSEPLSSSSPPNSAVGAPSLDPPDANPQSSSSSLPKKSGKATQPPTRLPSTPCLSPPLPSMLTVSSSSVGARANSLFSVNLAEGSTTQTTLPSFASILVNTSASGSGPAAAVTGADTRRSQRGDSENERNDEKTQALKASSTVPATPTTPGLPASSSGGVPMGSRDGKVRFVNLGWLETVVRRALKWAKKSFSFSNLRRPVSA